MYFAPYKYDESQGMSAGGRVREQQEESDEGAGKGSRRKGLVRAAGGRG